jgi:hypothetical protein
MQPRTHGDGHESAPKSRNSSEAQAVRTVYGCHAATLADQVLAWEVQTVLHAPSGHRISEDRQRYGPCRFVVRRRVWAG